MRKFKKRLSAIQIKTSLAYLSSAAHGGTGYAGVGYAGVGYVGGQGIGYSTLDLLLRITLTLTLT